MTDISLFIADVALREAVIEQIAAAKLGAVRVVDGPKKGIKGIFIIDDRAFDKNVVTALTTEEDEKLTVLLLGESEYAENVSESFAKPFRLGHLLTRLRYYLETAPLLRDRAVTLGPYRLEPQNRRIVTDNAKEPIRLTEKETALLVFLAATEKGATRKDILAEVWGYDERIDTHTLETHIYQLRRKLEAMGDNWLINEGGLYRLTWEQA